MSLFAQILLLFPISLFFYFNLYETHVEYIKKYPTSKGNFVLFLYFVFAFLVPSVFFSLFFSSSFKLYTKSTEETFVNLQSFTYSSEVWMCLILWFFSFVIVRVYQEHQFWVKEHRTGKFLREKFELFESVTKTRSFWFMEYPSFHRVVSSLQLVGLCYIRCLLIFILSGITLYTLETLVLYALFARITIANAYQSYILGFMVQTMITLFKLFIYLIWFFPCPFYVYCVAAVLLFAYGMYRFLNRLRLALYNRFYRSMSVEELSLVKEIKNLPDSLQLRSVVLRIVSDDDFLLLYCQKHKVFLG
jgi:hypothetical protein